MPILPSICGFSLTGIVFFFSSRRRNTRFKCDWSSDVCSSDLLRHSVELALGAGTPQFPCPHYPVPFVSPGGPPTFPAPSAPFVHPSGALSPVPLLSPHPA